MHKHIELADAGYTFLAAYSPSDLDTKRVMNVARRFRYALAQKYDRFSITEYQASNGCESGASNQAGRFASRLRMASGDSTYL